MNRIDENFFKNNTASKNSIESSLFDDEKILWKGRPKKMAYVLGRSLAIMPIGLIWGIIDIGILVTLFSNNFMPPQMLLFIIPFFALHLTPFWIWLYNLIKASNETKTVIYVITNKRIMIFKGENVVIDTALDIDEINDATLKVNFIDKMLGVGDIMVFAGQKKSIYFRYSKLRIYA